MQSLHRKDPQRIIVRMPNWIGDLVMATPVLSDLRTAYPQAHITAMCRSPIGDLLKEAPEIDELFCFNKSSGWSGVKEQNRVIHQLRRGRYDLGILLTHSFSSAWWFWQGKVKRRIGYVCNGRRLLLSQGLSFPENIQNQHLVMTYKELLGPLGIGLSHTSPRLYLAEKEMSDASLLFRQHGIPEGALVVGINPGATYGSAKCWLPERFREVAQRLLMDPDLYLVFFGDQATSGLVREICSGFSKRVVNLAGATSLRTLVSGIHLCDVLLTNDSGPMHVADAIGTPIVALFGSTSSIITGPYRSGIVIHKHVECSPCYERTCPIDFRCMKSIEVDEVCHAIMKMLSSKRSKLHITAL